jgi:hypothetical protein
MRHCSKLYVQDPYAQFLQVVRVWRVLTMEKRSGQAHGIDSIINQQPPGSLLVRCPACPRPSFNMDPDWQGVETSYRSVKCLTLANSDNIVSRHVHRLYISNDGNFHQQSKSKNSDPSDVSLVNSRGTFLDDRVYKSYLSKVGDSVEVFQPCSPLVAPY